MQSLQQPNEKNIQQTLEHQAHLYGELVSVLDKALDNYFDYLDDVMVVPEALHFKSLSKELSEMRDDLAELFDIAMHLRNVSQSQANRFKNLNIKSGDSL